MGGITDIDRTDVTVIAVDGEAPITGLGATRIVFRADIAVVAGAIIGDVLAAYPLETRIVRTGVTVVTGECFAAHTDAAITFVRDGAGIAIVAWGVVIGGHASHVGTTRFVGAGIAVVAAYGLTDAGTRYADIRLGTQTVIIAAHPFVEGCRLALAGGRLTGCLGAECVGIGRELADHNGVRVDDAFGLVA